MYVHTHSENSKYNFTISTDSTTNVKSYRIAIKLQSRFNAQ